MAKTLIVRYSQIGDILILLPLLNSLARKYPEDEFTVLTNPKFSDIFRQMPVNISLYPMTYRRRNVPLRGVVHLFHRYRLLLKFFLAPKYDKAIILQDGTFDKQLKRILSFRGSAVVKIDLSEFLSKKRLREKLPSLPFTSFPSLFKLYRETLSQSGYKQLENEFDLSHYTRPECQQDILASVGLNNGKKRLGIAPFSRIKAKMYPLERMEEIVAYYNRRQDVQVILLGGGKKEKTKAEEWSGRYPQVTSLINKLSFEDEISVIASCQAVISMDSANMHLAAFVGTPVISIWGPGDPRLGFYPVNEKEEHVVQRELSCRPCSFWSEIPCTHPLPYECMNIPPQVIIEKVNKLLFPVCEYMNPLLHPYNTPHEIPPFEQIKTEDFLPAFSQAIKECLAEVEEIANNPERPGFENTIAALEQSGRKLDDISALFFNLNAADTNKEMQEAAREISQQLTALSHQIHMNAALFERIREIHIKEKEIPGREQRTLLQNTWKSFIKGGANLHGEEAERFKQASVREAELCLLFEEHVLEETNDFELHITDREELAGLPESVIAAAALTAKEKQKTGWIFTLHAPSYLPFMKYAEKRALREKFYRAYASRGNRGNTCDNKALIREITALRLEKANLLGYATYAEYVLSDRMAQTSQEVEAFLHTLLERSHPFAGKDKKEVEAYARQNGFEAPLQRWDLAYFSNKLKRQKYDLDDEMLKPYFRLEKAKKRIFRLAGDLYGITFREVFNIPKYHRDVHTFEVYDGDGSYLSLLFLDFFPRSSKNGGAWMTEYRTQYKEKGKNIRPVISLVMNFTKPTETLPSLLTFDELTTFLHEFGHALHGMLSQTTYRSVAGTNVYRDFVELPSQLMENWAYEKEWLDQWATHYLTGEKIPQEYIDKIRRSANFQSGYACDRQVSFGLTDMAWHTITSPIAIPIEEFEEKAMEQTELFPTVEGSCFSTAFTHIFGGGYAAGYYSYKWAEILDADAFSLFKEKGIFNKEIAGSFRRNILEKGGTEHPMELYIRFRGRKPSMDALIERSGLNSFPEPY